MQELARPLHRLCQRSALDILALFQVQRLSVRQKPDGSPVTLADTRADASLREGLERLLPGVPVVSEESAMVPWSQRQRWSQYWLVDPLDGTRDFVRGSAHFAINIALIDEHQPVLGAIYLPLSGQLYLGGRGIFPQLMTGKGCQRLQLRTVDRGGVLKLLCSRNGSCHPAMLALRERLNRHFSLLLEEIRGSAWKYCRIAEGAGQLYPRFGATSEWDTAAGQALLEAGGGAVLDAQGQPLRYNAREDIINPDFFALGPADFSWPDVLGLAS